METLKMQKITAIRNNNSHFFHIISATFIVSLIIALLLALMLSPAGDMKSKISYMTGNYTQNVTAIDVKKDKTIASLKESMEKAKTSAAEKYSALMTSTSAKISELTAKITKSTESSDTAVVDTEVKDTKSE
jgi:predicted PurR-regulated permease PerM